MKILVRALMITCFMFTQVFGQNAPKDSSKDPLKVAPQAYKLELENDWVRVTRVRYEARAKIAEHYHTERPSAYVYLNDAGPVIFKHKDLPYGDITRAAVKAGTFRVYRGVKEVHAVENPSETASEFLRVEFKTEPLNQHTLRGKFHREPLASGENSRKVQFENEQIRITRMVIAPHKTMDQSTNATEPALLVALTKSELQKGKTRVNLEIGKTRWLGVNQKEVLENSGDAPVELLRFEFKTKPFHDPTDRTDVHDHKHTSEDKED
jgi:quercetin dioxygenase-like cupin family protein